MSSGSPVPRAKPIGIFTVDLEDWFHPLVKDPRGWDQFEDRVAIGTHRLLDLLASTHSTATFFVLGWVALRNPELIAAILAAGHEVGTHGHHHLSLKRLELSGFERDLDASLRALERVGAPSVTAYRAPYFSLDASTRWAARSLSARGIRIDSSMFPLKTGYYGDRRLPNTPFQLDGLTEHPITLPEYLGLRVPLTGGFYCRFFPSALTVSGVSRVAARGAVPMFYIHPWELDPDQPRIKPQSRFLEFRHYLRLDRTESTILTVLRQCRWRSLSDVAGAVDP
jgi:polysaccharide deacetylase family protein (PEP-CTERM system associated)